MFKNNHQVTSFFICLLLIMSGFLLAACSQKEEEDQHKTAIKKVLEHQFTGPDEEFIELNNKEEIQELGKYYAKVYGPYFTESGLDSFVAAFATQYPTYANDSGYKLSLKNITIEQSENTSNRYSFIAEVGCQKNGEEEKTANVEGDVRFSTKDEGKIEGFQYVNDNGLTDMLRAGN
ncbi:hypothetical protein [Neobacillus sp. 19]|uniref:hypothetical protein n=1 Tax=Neobacillus sp. 19 TaxID=3394458 RepID=UPI003BF743FE